jgi:hypothetical protein
MDKRRKRERDTMGRSAAAEKKAGNAACRENPAWRLLFRKICVDV